MMLRRPFIKVLVDGKDVTGNFLPVLIKVEVTKKEKGSAHTAALTLADPDGIIEIPATGAPIIVMAGYSVADVGWIFEGSVNDVKSKGSKTSGRTLMIGAISADQKGKIKQQLTRHKDNARLGDVAKEFGEKAGLEVSVIGDITNIHRKYWSITRESFQSWGQRLAREIGASFQVIGKRAIFSPMNDGKSASGKALTPVAANAGLGGTLLSWDIAPALARPDYGEVRIAHFDRKSGEWKAKTRKVEGANSKTSLSLLHASADEDEADQKAKGAAETSKREKGGGSIRILGDHAAEPGAFCHVSGAREGVDNTYIIECVEHDISKDGWVTDLKLKLPKQEDKSKKKPRSKPKPTPPAPKPKLPILSV